MGSEMCIRDRLHSYLSETSHDSQCVVLTHSRQPTSLCIPRVLLSVTRCFPDKRVHGTQPYVGSKLNKTLLGKTRFRHFSLGKTRFRHFSNGYFQKNLTAFPFPKRDHNGAGITDFDFLATTTVKQPLRLPQICGPANFFFRTTE